MIDKFGKKIGLFFLVGIGLFLIINLIWKAPLPQNQPQVLKDQKGNLISGIKKQTYEKEELLPENLKKALIKIEDQRYYRHLGIDPIAILRALAHNLMKDGKRQGASTLPQQLVKLSQQAYHRSWKQKIKEMLIAFNLSLHYSKEEVLRTYLNQVEFLNGIRGYKSACESYFGKPCAALFPSELSFLIATAQLGKNPLQEKGFATIKKKAEQLCIHAFGSEQCKDWEQLPPLANSELKLPPNNLLPQLSEYQAGTEEKDQISAFDLQLYEQINQLLDRSKDYRKQLAMEDCCVIVLNKAGQILSMNTCRPFDEEEQGQVNGCLRKRQTGSAIKPFLYSLAFHTLVQTGGTMILDEEIAFPLAEGYQYRPKNFSLKTYGEVSLADALGNSLNIPAVKLVHELGVQTFLDFLLKLRQAFGSATKEEVAKDQERFSAKQLGLSVALGTYEMSPLHFAELWRFFFDEKKEGLEAYEKGRDEVYSILTKNQHRILSFGLDNYLNQAGWASKSGTSRHFIDGRSCGIHREKELISCVRSGNYDGSPMKKSGILTAGYLWNLVVSIL